MRMRHNLSFSQAALAAYCRKHHIRRLALFGSVLRDDFRQDSDVDVLVEFESGHVPGFISLSAMQIELSQILGRQADMRTPASLSRYFRQEVVDNAVVQYEPN